MILIRFINLIFPADKYYKMSDGELEKMASRGRIGMYGTHTGQVNRQIIIDALIKKDQINFSFGSIIVSFIAIIISIIAILK